MKLNQSLPQSLARPTQGENCDELLTTKCISEIGKLRLLCEVLEDARVHSGVRYLGTRVANFCRLLEPFIVENQGYRSSPALDQSQRDKLLDLYTRFSAEISLLCSSIITDRSCSNIHSLESMLRTPLEEAILSLQSDDSSTYRDPAVVKSWLTDGYRAGRHSLSDSYNPLPKTIGTKFSLHNVWIQDFGSSGRELSDTDYGELLSLVNSRVVDTNVPEKREGFGRAYSIEEFTTLLRRTTTHLYVPYTPDGSLGIFTIDSTLRNQSGEIQAALQEKYPSDPPISQAGWVDIIALTGHARDCVRSPSDTWIVGREILSDGSVSEIPLRPTDSTDVGPGDFIVDISKGIHRITHNSAFKMEAPAQWEVSTTHGQVFTKDRILLYLKTSPHGEKVTVPCEPSLSSTYEIASALQPSSVTEVGCGDFVLDRSGRVLQIERNSATGAFAPKSWSLYSTRGEILGMFDVDLYLKRTPISSEDLDSLRAPSLYRWLTVAACESSLSLGITSLFCQVRIGAHGNSAREKHIAVGWEPTGVTFTAGNFEYEILRLDPIHILTGLRYREVSHIASATFPLKEDQIHLRLLGESVWSDPPKVSEQENCLERVKRKFPTCNVHSAVDSLHRLQIKVTPQSGPSIYFIQGLANADLWRIQDELIYTHSLFNRFSSLETALQRC